MPENTQGQKVKNGNKREWKILKNRKTNGGNKGNNVIKKIRRNGGKTKR